MTLKITNNATGFLAANLASTDTGTTLATAAQANSFPTLATGDYFYATITSTTGLYEIVKVTARVGNVFTLVRAQESTTARSFPIGSRFELRVTAQNLLDVIANDEDYGTL